MIFLDKAEKLCAGRGQSAQLIGVACVGFFCRYFLFVLFSPRSGNFYSEVYSAIAARMVLSLGATKNVVNKSK